MRRFLSCVLMTTLLLCSCGGAGGGRAAELAVLFRNELEAAQTLEYAAEIRADYDGAIFECAVRYSGGADEAAVTLTAPEGVAGITARLTKDSAAIEYDGVILDAGEPLSRLSPAAAVPEMVKMWREGFIAETSPTKYGDIPAVLITFYPEKTDAGELAHSLIISEDLTPLRAEIALDGKMTVAAEFIYT